MKIKAITVATQPAHGLEMLEDSMRKHDIDYVVLGMGTQWRGFGTKLKLCQKYLRELEGYSHFVFVDAYDVAFTTGMQTITDHYKLFFPGKIVFSAEKGCWPYPDKAPMYPECNTPWKYLNSGSYMAPINDYLDLLDKYPFEYHTDDQAYFTDVFLSCEAIKLDTECIIFQSIAFADESDFICNKYLFNNITKSIPQIIHGNGKTPMDKIYAMI